MIDKIIGVLRNKTPVYVFNAEIFKKDYQSLVNAFRKIYPETNIAYSYKTNYAPSICCLVNKMGGMAEVVSPEEYLYATELGIPGTHIVFNGVCKDYNSIEDAVMKGSIINADSVNDFRKIVEATNITKVNPVVGLRINLDIGNGLNSRFGIVPYSEDFNEIINIAQKNDIKVSCLHCHISKARELEFWEKRASFMLKIADEFEGLEYIDLGSNMFSPMEPFLAKQFGDNLPTFDDYAEVVATKFADKFPDNTVKLIIEAGTPVVSNSVMLLSKVVDIKEIRGETFAVLDCSSQDLGFLAKYKDVPIEIIKNSNINSKDKEYKLVGCTCIEDDVIRNSITCSLDIGDLVLLKNIGAYGNNLSPDFIRPSIGMVELKGDYIIEVKNSSQSEMFNKYSQYVRRYCREKN